jgi:hypothetical protein
MDEIEKLDIKPQALDPETFSAINENIYPPVNGRNRLKNLLSHFKNRLQVEKQKTSSPQEKNWDSYTRQRYPTFSLNEIQIDLKKLQEITGRFSNIQVCQTGNDRIYVYPTEN